MGQTLSLISELEEAIQSGSKDKRVETLRRITDLFVADADRFNHQQIEVFDDVLSHLIKRIQGKALAELSQRLAPVNNAPLEVVRRLARDDDVTIAAPVLRQSSRLTDDDLVDIANTKNQGHLLAIASRPTVGPQVTDVLLQRGDRDVFHTLAENSGANFSENGFATLARHAEKDACNLGIANPAVDGGARLPMDQRVLIAQLKSSITAGSWRVSVTTRSGGLLASCLRRKRPDWPL